MIAIAFGGDINIEQDWQLVEHEKCSVLVGNADFVCDNQYSDLHWENVAFNIL